MRETKVSDAAATMGKTVKAMSGGKGPFSPWCMLETKEPFSPWYTLQKARG